MEMQDQQPQRRPLRRQRSKMRIFKEAYLPTIILGLTVIFILTFIIGSAVRKNSENSTLETSTSSTSTPAPDPDLLLQQGKQELLARAEEAAKDYDYAGALAILDTFSGNLAEHPDLVKVYERYQSAEASLVSWSPAQVPNLSFHILIADPDRAFPDGELGSAYKRNFITTTEFSNILQQLYANGYVLVSLDDLYTAEFDSSTGRDIYKESVLRLPAGKKPLMITEVNASYYTYMVDSDGDGQPDAGADGFASKLCYDGSKFYNEIVNADGSATQGAHDMVPILESFIARNPDFSYRGARATIAFTGSDGILGHRVSQGQSEIDGAVAVTTALREHGYHLACYTYDNVDYAKKTAAQIQDDLHNWAVQVTAIIGQVDVLAFARDSDIADTSSTYDGSKFTVLHNAGFRYYMGISSAPWNQVGELYIRHNRLMITGENLAIHQDWYVGLFDADSVRDPARNNY